ncbi:OPSX protein, partial [Sylvietta virens]|nr:OPSX protein [Sylvietta virens]
LTLLFGLASINTLTVISVTRYIKGCHPERGHCISNSSMSVALVLIWVAAFFWSAAPLLGWGSYTGNRYLSVVPAWHLSTQQRYSTFLACSPRSAWLHPSKPFACSYSLVSHTLRATQTFPFQPNVQVTILSVSIVICTAFIIAWSPYAVISIWSAYGHPVPNLTSILASLFAKSASFYNPIIYFGMSSKFRRDIFILFHC